VLGGWTAGTWSAPAALRRRALATLLGGLAAALACTALLPARSEAAGYQCGVQAGLGTFSASNQPGSCWRPYSDASPFNRTIPFGAPSVPDSTQKVGEFLDQAALEQFVFGDPQRDGGVPIYWSQPSDPVYTLHCTKPWGHCDLEGLQIHLPAQAMPTGGWSTDQWEHDAHMTVIDQSSGWEYDMWQVQGKSGSTLNVSWGGKTRIDGDGLDSDAVSARYGSIAGPIRPEELIAGQINHALAMVVPCTDDYVYPAVQASTSCEDMGLPASLSVPMGAHFQLRMSQKQIARLKVPTWKKAVVRALATYGAYVSDTAGGSAVWAFEKASGDSYAAFGQPNPWVQWAKAQGVPPEDFNDNGFSEYWFDLAPGIPWKRLRIVSTCAADGTCPVVDRSPVLRARAARCRRSLVRWKRRVEHFDSRAHRRHVRWSRHCGRLAERARGF
jgi:hypothetical protein